jgi:RNA polymerase sigma factor (sigma-70 family)
VCRTWVIRTAAHKAIDLIRRAISRSDHENASARAAAPGENALELGYLLNARIAGLPARLRALYELHYARGLTERETAVELGVCRQTVRWLDSRCRRSLTGSEALSGSRAHPRDPPCDEK